MADEDDASKTEDPTPKKLDQARKKGQAAVSQEVKSWFILVAGTVGLVMMAPGIARDVQGVSAPFIHTPDLMPVDFEHLRVVFSKLLLEVGWILAPLMGLLVLIAAFGSLVQTGLLFAPDRVKPDIGKVSLIKGFKQRFSMMAVVEFLKGIAKLAIVTVVALALTLVLLTDIEIISAVDLRITLDRVYAIAIRLAAGTVAVMTVVAVLDFAFQKMKFTKQMRMTKQELKDEHKQAEGDPQVKARIRTLRIQRAQQRMMAAVPEADVVVTNPTHYAVALTYKMTEMQAPRLVAKGVDTLAERIRQVAEGNDVPIVENPPLARALYASVDLDQEIPPEHYKAVAEIIGYVMRLRGDLPPL